MSFRAFHEGNERSWVGVPFREVTGDKPSPSDVPPQRTPAGDFIFYHGTSRTRAAAIMRERFIRPDNLGVVGVATVPGQASVFAIMSGNRDKENPRTGLVLRVVIDKDWLGKQAVTREVGGSGHDQFLIQPPGDKRGWLGVPLKAVRKR